MTGLFDVAGKTALVTGGSRGIGLMIARGLVEAGARVIISSRNSDACHAAAAGVSTLVDGVEAAAPVLHILVNNAGATWGAALDDFPLTAFDKVLNVNVRAVFALTKALLPQLRAAAKPGDPARIINIGSVDGLVVSATENYSYGASKAALHMLTRKIAADLASEHITANVLAPGPFPTKMMTHVLSDPKLTASVPLGRVGTPDDIAGAAIFLSSRAGSYITGAVVPVDGGISGTR